METIKLAALILASGLFLLGIYGGFVILKKKDGDEPPQSEGPRLGIDYGPPDDPPDPDKPLNK